MKMLHRAGPFMVLAALLLFAAAPEGAYAKPGKGKANATAKQEKTAGTQGAQGKPTPQFEVGDLIAGQHTKVGTVEVEVVCEDGAPKTLVVTYRTTGGWCMTETHLYVGTEAPSSTAPGSFKDSLAGEIHGDLDCVTMDVYEVDISGLDVDELHVAAHAVVEGSPTASLAALCESLPETLAFTLSRPDPRVTYFEATITDPPGFLDGLTLPAWCIDTGTSISPGTFDGSVFCLEDLLPSDVLFPENLPQVLYILNHYEDGMPDGMGGTYTMADIQRAIWNLVAGTPADGQTRFGQPGNAMRLETMLADAALNGVDYQPGCGDLAGFVVEPFRTTQPNANFQVLLFVFPLNCPEGEETAWGFGEDAFSKKWGWSRVVSIACDD